MCIACSKKDNIQHRESVGRGPLWGLAGAVGMAVAVVDILYLIARVTGDQLVTRPEFGGEPAPLSLALVSTATVFGALVGIVLALLCRRFVERSFEAFIAASLIALAVYGGVAFVRAESVPTALWLNAMHVGAAIPMLWGIARYVFGGRVGNNERR